MEGFKPKAENESELPQKLDTEGRLNLRSKLEELGISLSSFEE